MKSPTIFFGASAYVLPLIHYINETFDLKLVITTEQKVTDAVPAYCLTHNIPYIVLKSFKDPLWQNDWKLKIANLQLEFAILADFGLLVPQSVLDTFPKGIINIHPSLLPAYRGPTPGMSAILYGETTTGVSIMLLDKELDHGPLIGQVKTDIKPDDTSATLYPRLFAEGTQLLQDVLPNYLTGKIKPIEQDHSKATFTLPHLTRESGYIDFNNVAISSETRNLSSNEISHSDRNDKKIVSPKQLDQMIRAFFPWPTLWTKYTGEGRLNGKIIKFLPSSRHPELVEGSHTKNAILLQVEGKKPQPYKDFLNGHPEAKEWLEKIVGR